MKLYLNNSSIENNKYFKTHKELLETDNNYAKTYKSIDKSKGFG